MITHPGRAVARTLTALLAILGVVAVSAASPPPNIVIVYLDDLGYSDIACFGGEIPTPAIDRLAANGLRFTQFYNTGRCCPSRASLLTGIYAHRAGVGHMTDDLGPDSPGYRGRLDGRCVTIAEALAPAGYVSAAIGKWHLGHEDRAWWPRQRGFDRFFGTPRAPGGYFEPKNLVLDDEPVPDARRAYPDWYSTDAWTDFAVRFVDEAVEAEKPFFLYLAHNAPHYPLQAPEEEIERHIALYEPGWDVVRRQRYARQLEMGIIEAGALSPRDVARRRWAELREGQRTRQSRAMGVYAAVVARVDHGLGRLVDTLETRGVLDSTLILVLSDNGGCAVGGKLAEDKSDAGAWGSRGSSLKYGRIWANVSNTPFLRYKRDVHEGGIATPLVVHWPDGIPAEQRARLCRVPAHVIDIMPTCLEVAGVELPTRRGELETRELDGRSLVPLFRGSDDALHEVLCWEHEGNRAIRAGQWKLVSHQNSGGEWELYDLAHDRTETNDLASAQPEIVERLAGRWAAWADDVGVRPWPEVKAAVKAKRAANRERRPGAAPEDPPVADPSPAAR
jgi:arylsulfatase